MGAEIEKVFVLAAVKPNRIMCVCVSVNLTGLGLVCDERCVCVLCLQFDAHNCSVSNAMPAPFGYAAYFHTALLPTGNWRINPF